MDGVLVEYNKADFIGNHPKYLREGTHYFRHLRPDNRVLSVMKGLSQNKNCKVYILTSVINNEKTINEHINDKRNWTKEFCPFLHIDSQLLITQGAKHHIISQIHNRPLNHDDILIDDYNKNLNLWSDAGGSCVKYANGTNNPYSFDGPLILQNESVNNIVTKLLSI